MRLALVFLVACGGAAPAPAPAPAPVPGAGMPSAPREVAPKPDTVAAADPDQGGEVAGDPDGGGERGGGGGIGKVGTLGGGGGTGTGTGYGSKGKSPNVSVGTPIVMGSLDKEVIRRVVKRHAGEIRHCYEKQLVAHPDLEGKVTAKWTIKADGTVANITATGLNLDVERCLIARIATWKFPSPVGGGVVIVSYPFVFKREQP